MSGDGFHFIGDVFGEGTSFTEDPFADPAPAVRHLPDVFSDPADPIELNVAPSLKTFCPDYSPPRPAVIRFPGGFQIQATVDPTKGPPGKCSQLVDLVGKLEALLAPLTPLLQVLDLVATAVQCMTLMKDAISDPTKIPDLLSCFPGLLAKLNELLGLVPALPQGILKWVTLVADVIGMAIVAIDCAVAQLEAIREQFRRLQADLEVALRTEDVEQRRSLEQLAACALAAAEQDADAATSSLGSIARILCTVRAILTLIPGFGRTIARQLKFPEPSRAAGIDGAIQAMRDTRTVLNDVLNLLYTLGGGFAVTPPPSLTFRCALDEAPEAEPPAEDVPTPSLESADPPTLPQAVAGDPDAVTVLRGTNLRETTQVFWGTAQVDPAKVTLGGGALTVRVPAGVRTNTGTFQLTLVNVPASLGAPFSGLSATAGAAGDSGVRTSNQLPVDVA